MSGLGRTLSRVRLSLLRVAYAIMAFGLALTVWPQLAQIGPGSPHMGAVVVAMLSAMGVLAFIGLFKPVEMLPLLLLEVVWKVIWLALVGLPAAIGGTASPAIAASTIEIGLVAIIVPLIPWDRLGSMYFRRASTS